MTELKQQLQSALVVEQQSLAQSHIKYSLQHLGFERIDFVDRAHLAIESIKKRQYQLILCAYELNKGADGFQLFERLHAEHLLKCGTCFVFMSSDNDLQLSHSIIELNPDDFLLKPFTSRELEQRLKRVLTKKVALADVFNSLDLNDLAGALSRLNDYISKNESPNWLSYLMKMKGEILKDMQDWQQTSDFYESVLKVKPFQWAQLGLVECHLHLGRFAEAKNLLSDLIDARATRLPALELMTELCELNDKFDDALFHLKKATELAPRNVERQQHLYSLARITYDFDSQYQASNSIIRNLRHSVHESPEAYLTAVRANVDYGLTSFNETEVNRLAQQSQHILDNLKKKFPKEALNEQIGVATARIHFLKNETSKAKQIIESQLEQVNLEQVDNLEDALDMAKALHELGFHKDSERMFSHIAKVAEDSPNTLFNKFITAEKQLREEVKSSPKQLNNDAVNHYTRGNLKEALNAFTSAFKVMPKNPSIALNLLQTMAESPFLDFEAPEVKVLLDKCQATIDSATINDEQAERYRRLKQKLQEERI
ncbi:tetratricopeptide repeat protein [Psychrosphaera ytuae]|uniref:Tetratricopeptide repeat protein n=1 Tax=Psychrosphaera ytuae TaxID=2820710 RepID=A0A975DB04_9GAMM|nr:tetratricopeptide repeat protein [Psychrosphaera ytuae]QTH63816.1 tetratricopeptide repeat protein [Psychrosphaera ytuae]